MPKADDLLASRVREVRRDIHGDDVGAQARAMGVPARTWDNYERGVMIPGRVILAFIVYTGVEPCWLLHGEGERYRQHRPGVGPCD